MSFDGIGDAVFHLLIRVSFMQPTHNSNRVSAKGFSNDECVEALGPWVDQEHLSSFLPGTICSLLLIEVYRRMIKF